MPLALSKTARTLNSWSPMHGGIDIAAIQTKKEQTGIDTPAKTPYENYLPEVSRPAFRPTSFEAKANRRNQNRQLAHSKAMFELTETNGHSNFPKSRENQFAQQPRPKAPVVSIDSGSVTLSPVNDETNSLLNDEPIVSTNNKEVRFLAAGTLPRNGFNPSPRPSYRGVFKSAWPNSNLSCGSALVLARSPSSVSHLRKWNSQTDLSSFGQEKSSNKNTKKMTPIVTKSREPDKKVLSRNASLPDLRRADLLDATKFHRARPKHEPNNDNLLMRSPSETGRTLTFWLATEEGTTRGEGAVKGFNESAATRRFNYEYKLGFLRNHWFGTIRNNNVISGPKQNGGPKLNGVNERLKDDNSTEINDFSPKILADELALLGREVLLAVEPVELITFVMKPAFATEENCPNLHRLLCFYQRITGLVTTEILRSDNPAKRAQILSLFVETADSCRSMQNWQSSKAILSAILSPAVARLNQTWAQLQKDYPYHYSLFESLTTENKSENKENGDDNLKPRPLAALSYFGDVMSRIRGRPTIERLRPARPLWKEPPSMAKWVEEQIASGNACDTCHSITHKNRACCYLMVFVLGKNFFCPIRRIPDDFTQTPLSVSSTEFCNGEMYNSRLDLAKVFDDPESLPFTSPHIECCALQPQRVAEIRRRAEIFLRSAQATARAYDLQSNQRTRNYLLRQPYISSLDSMKRSWLLEPRKANR